MGIMDSLVKNEEKIENGGRKKAEKDPHLINTYFKNDGEEFFISGQFIAFEDVYPEVEGMVTRKRHYPMFHKIFKEKNNCEELGSLPAVADIKSHGFSDYNILEDLKWSFWNAHKATGEEKWKNLSNAVQEKTESYCYWVTFDSSDPELIGKVNIFKVPQNVKKDYILDQYTKFGIDVFSDDVFVRIDKKGKDRDTKYTVSDEKSKKFKGLTLEEALKNNGLTIEDVKKTMLEQDITRYVFNKENELMIMEEIEEKFDESYDSVMDVITTYSKSKLKKRGVSSSSTGVAPKNVTEAVETENGSDDDPKPFNVDEDDDDDMGIF